MPDSCDLAMKGKTGQKSLELTGELSVGLSMEPSTLRQVDRPETTSETPASVAIARWTGRNDVVAICPICPVEGRIVDSWDIIEGSGGGCE